MGTTDGTTAEDTRFARLLAGADVSDTRFARLVNDRARQERNVELGLARTTVGHWRRGMRPRNPDVAELACGELSRLVGYPVAPADLGWRGEGARDDLGLAVSADPAGTLGALVGLAERDTRRGVLASCGAFAVAAFAEPALSSVTGVIKRLDGGHVPAPASAATVRGVAEVLRRADARYGSTRVWLQAATFLRESSAEAARGAAGADVFAALSELAQFAGWLAQDLGRHATAQRYYIQALGLAEHAGDAMLAGRALSSMADQAGLLGHRRHSLSLARAALERSERHSCAAVRAILHDRHAWALARVGDEAGCTGALGAMESAIAVADPGDTPAWAVHYGEADVAECQGHCLLLLDRREASAARLLHARETQAPERARTRSYAEAGLGLAYLHGDRPDLDAALDAAGRALDIAESVSSGRLAGKLAELEAALSGYDQVAVRQWRARLAGWRRGEAAG